MYVAFRYSLWLKLYTGYCVDPRSYYWNLTFCFLLSFYLLALTAMLYVVYLWTCYSCSCYFRFIILTAVHLWSYSNQYQVAATSYKLVTLTAVGTRSQYSYTHWHTQAAPAPTATLYKLAMACACSMGQCQSLSVSETHTCRHLLRVLLSTAKQS